MSFPTIGQTFGEFVITGRLGVGGMGAVFEADQPRLGRRVALKVLAPQYLADERFRARFEAEAGLLAALSSPHIVTVYDHGEVDGCLYIATQIVDGGDLKSRLRAGGPLSPALALDIAIQVADALSDAHGKGVIHRDIKPGNVLLTERAVGTHAVLCDFGIAQDDESDFTVTGELIGTMAYIAPERLQGQRADVRSDIYSLGCLLHEMVFGVAPPPGGGLAHPEAADEAIGALIARATASNPEWRFQSCIEMRQAMLEVRGSASADVDTATRLRPHQQSTVLRAAGATLPDSLPAVASPGRRSGASRMMGAGALALVLLTAGGLWWGLSRPGGAAGDGPTGAASRASDPSAGSSSASPVTTSPSPSPSPKPDNSHVCWNGSRSTQKCDVSSAGAALWAFGFQQSQCDLAYGWGTETVPSISYRCYANGDRRQPDIHVARYIDQARRATRMVRYGISEGRCLSRSGGTVDCGPDEKGRYVRTYEISAGILIYASALDRQALSAVPQRTAQELFYGPAGG